jgi:hypothetical protein
MYVEKCQFLIGNVQRLQYRRSMLSSDNRVSIPHRQCTTRKKRRKDEQQRACQFLIGNVQLSKAIAATVSRCVNSS